MEKSIFRKSSIDKVSSPEQLNEYIRVTRPGIWILLAAIMALLVGCLIWSFFGVINTSINTGILIDGQSAVCYISPQTAASVKKGMPVSVGETTGKIKSVSGSPVQISPETDPYLRYLGGLTVGDFCNVAQVDISGLENGVYEAKITTDSLNPIVFIIR